MDAEVRLAIYDYILLEGAVPTIRDLAARLSLSEDEVRGALRRLHDARMLFAQPESGEILMAHPFSAVPTGFRVEADEQGWWANCIWDALGIPLMLRRDATISTSCPCCGDPMKVRIENGTITEGEGVIHFAVPAKHWWDDIVFT